MHATHQYARVGEEIPASDLRQREELRLAIEEEHHCCATPVISMPVDVASEENSWSGMVEAFDLARHPSAERCYAWRAGSHHEQVVSVLKRQPISCAEEAVRSWLKA